MVWRYNAGGSSWTRAFGITYRLISIWVNLSTIPQIAMPIDCVDFSWPSTPHSSFGPIDHRPCEWIFLAPGWRAFTASGFCARRWFAISSLTQEKGSQQPWNTHWEINYEPWNMDSFQTKLLLNSSLSLSTKRVFLSDKTNSCCSWLLA